jgi:hypothetical protein
VIPISFEDYWDNINGWRIGGGLMDGAFILMNWAVFFLICIFYDLKSKGLALGWCGFMAGVGWSLAWKGKERVWDMKFA